MMSDTSVKLVETAVISLVAEPVYKGLKSRSSKETVNRVTVMWLAADIANQNLCFCCRIIFHIVLLQFR